MATRDKETIMNEFNLLPKTEAEEWEAQWIFKRIMIEVLVDIRDQIGLVGDIIEDLRIGR